MKVCGAITLYITSDNSNNNISLSNSETGDYNYRKLINSVDYDAIVNDGLLSKQRNHILTLSDADGITHSLNNVTGNNTNTDDVIGLDSGDGLLHLGATGAEILHLNAGLSLLSVLDQP